jgi:CRISPR system Cascade subunit CasC
MTGRFLQVHYLTSYPAALLNRDDAGFAKRIPFGGATRTRISSQCLKRHWRSYDGEYALQHIERDGRVIPMSVRSRRTFERFIWQPLRDEVGDEMATAVTQAMMAQVLGQSKKTEKAADDDNTAAIRSGQVTVLGRPEVDFLFDQARVIATGLGDSKKAKQAVETHFKGEAGRNLRSLRLGAGLDAALFGRMITSDILARGDAAVHVQHAMTVHEEAAETDYFSAVDDLLQDAEEEQLGSGHIGTSELTSGFYYGYVVVDVPLLVSNLEGAERSQWLEVDRSLAAEVVHRLVHLVATVSPGAKLGSTAPYAYASLVLVEAGAAQPRTLANAFLSPVAQRPDVVRNTYRALSGHLEDLDHMYGRSTERRLAALGPLNELDSVVPLVDHLSLASLAAWASRQVVE